MVDPSDPSGRSRLFTASSRLFEAPSGPFEDRFGLFEDRFGGPAPDFVVRAPGRVNLIGEHIDYSLLPVLPMAIQLGASLTVRRREDRHVRLSNAEAAYADVEMELSPDVERGGRSGRGDWGDYARGVAQTLVRDLGITRGADITVESDLPIAAGLSSSSALSCGVALALLAVNDREVDRLELADLVAAAERYTGTQGGGMDHAAILCGRAGHALGVSFAPLNVRPVEVPDDWFFLVAHSGVVAEKSGLAQTTYNARTRESREALATVWASMVTPEDSSVDSPANSPGDSPVDSPVNSPSPEKDYSPLIEAGGGPERLLDLASGVLAAPLLGRFRHAVSESFRVAEAELALAAKDLGAFGRLMDASHRSLRDDYEVSTPELDRIVDLAREAGAAGARLTGAGLGGAALILCTGQTEGAVREALITGYYAPRGQPSSEHVLFRAVPSGGATVRSIGA